VRGAALSNCLLSSKARRIERPPITEMRGISTSFGAEKARGDVNFSCRRSEAHVLVGENGAGKSTILKIIPGLYPAETGTILMNRKPVRFRSPQEA
jgi:putative multiple sugar transport system ATP-binding protein